MTQKEAPIVDYEPRPPHRQAMRDDLAYILPMAIFLGLTWAGGNWKSLYPASYVVKTIAVAIALIVLWRRFTPIRWNGWWLGVIVGVVGIFQWVGMQLFLQKHFEHFRPSPDVFDPTKVFENPAMLYGFFAVRLIGAVLVVPVMEELFWRDFLWRSVIAPNDFKLAKVGEWDWKAFAIVSLAFAVVHGNWWLTSIVWAAMVGCLLVYTKSLGACIIAHAVTNLLLGAYVLWTKDWAFW
jgi:CAAX prenyl protease-like protein